MMKVAKIKNVKKYKNARSCPSFIKSCWIPFQYSPVLILMSVMNAVPKLLKLALASMLSHLQAPYSRSSGRPPFLTISGSPGSKNPSHLSVCMTQLNLLGSTSGGDQGG